MEILTVEQFEGNVHNILLASQSKNGYTKKMYAHVTIIKGELNPVFIVKDGEIPLRPKSNLKDALELFNSLNEEEE